MDRETIIKLAREAEFHVTNERVQSPVIGGSDLFWLLERFAKLVAEHEREACAEVCDEWVFPVEIQGAHPDYLEGKRMAMSQCAAAIRARGQ